MMDKIDHVAASDVVSAAVLAALVARLRRTGTVSEEDEREVYEHALLLLGKRSANSPPEMQPVMRAARQAIEQQLR